MKYHPTLDEIESRYGVQWSFATARYTIAFWAEDEDLPPRDSFEREDDIAFASDGEPAHWFCAMVGIFDAAGNYLAYVALGGCSYGSFREFYSAHRWQYSRRQGRWITDPRSRAWKALEARRPRRPDGSRADGHYFPQMVREVISAARVHETRRTMTAC
jgi:hypothetical protein